jgi:hypothetical protein
MPDPRSGRSGHYSTSKLARMPIGLWFICWRHSLSMNESNSATGPRMRSQRQGRGASGWVAMDRTGSRPAIAMRRRRGRGSLRRMSARQMAPQLIERGIPTANGGRWHAATVIRAMDRAGL